MTNPDFLRKTHASDIPELNNKDVDSVAAAMRAKIAASFNGQEQQDWGKIITADGPEIDLRALVGLAKTIEDTIPPGLEGVIIGAASPARILDQLDELIKAIRREEAKAAYLKRKGEAWEREAADSANLNLQSVTDKAEVRAKLASKFRALAKPVFLATAFLLASCARLIEPANTNTNLNPTATAAEVLPTVAPTANPLDQINATPTPESAPETAFDLKTHLVELDIISPEAQVEFLEWTDGIVQMIRVTQLMGEEGMLKNVSEFVGYEDYVAMVYVAPPIEANSQDRFMAIGLRAGESFTVNQQTGEYVIVNEAGAVVREYDPITRSFVEVEEVAPTATVTPETTVPPVPYEHAVPYEHPAIPENLQELYNREVDKVNHHNFVGEYIVKDGEEEEEKEVIVRIEFPIFTAHEGFSDFDLFSFSEVHETDLLVEMIGNFFLHQCHFRYNFDRRGTGEEVSFEEYLKLVSRGEGQVVFHHYREVSPRKWEITQTTIDPRNGPALAIELIDDRVYQFDENYGFPKITGDPQARSRGFVDLSVNDLGQPVVTITLPAEFYRKVIEEDGLDPIIVAGNNYITHIFESLRYIGGADEHYVHNRKSLESSQEGRDDTQRRSIEALWAYYYPGEKVPDLSNLNLSTWPKELREKLYAASDKGVREGYPHLIGIVSP